MQTDRFGGVWISGSILMLDVPQVHGPPSLPAVLFAAAGLGAGEDIQDLRGGAAHVLLDLDVM